MQNKELCDEKCPVARANAVLGGKWTTLIVRDLLSGTKRYSQLQRSLEGISPRVLAQRLKELETAGMIRKKIYPTVPPKTEYSLTKVGKKAQSVILAMAEFGQGIG